MRVHKNKTFYIGTTCKAIYQKIKKNSSQKYMTVIILYRQIVYKRRKIIFKSYYENDLTICLKAFLKKQTLIIFKGCECLCTYCKQTFAKYFSSEKENVANLENGLHVYYAHMYNNIMAISLYYYKNDVGIYIVFLNCANDTWFQKVERSNNNWIVGNKKHNFNIDKAATNFYKCPFYCVYNKKLTIDM